MAHSVIRRHCQTCQQQRAFEKEKPSHILHLLLSAVTVGAWVLIWLLVIVLNYLKPYRCRECGKAAIL